MARRAAAAREPAARTFSTLFKTASKRDIGPPW
jgi:hypothetical protein